MKKKADDCLMKKKIFFIQILEPPKNMMIWNPNDEDMIHVKEGFRLVLNCSVDPSVPAANMSWRNNNIILAIQYETTNITYHMIAKKKHHMEQFDCVADNELYILNRSIRAFVNRKFRKSNQDFYVLAKMVSLLTESMTCKYF